MRHRGQPDGYRRWAEKHIVPTLGKLPTGSVRREHMRDLHYAIWTTPAMANRTLDLLVAEVCERNSLRPIPFWNCTGLRAM